MRRRIFAFGLVIFGALAGAPSPAAVNSAAVLGKSEMPPVERKWTERDYETVLALMRQAQPSDLPRAHSPVLQRLVDPQNLEILSDGATPLDMRLRLGSRLVASTTDVLRLYLGALQTDATRNDEVIWIEGFMMQEASILVALANQNLAGVAPSSAGYADRADSLVQMKRGLREVVVGCLMALETKSPASNETRRHLAAVLHSEWPKISPLLPAEARSEIEGTLKLLSQNESDPRVKAAFAGS